jgi:hypothetical protein
MPSLDRSHFECVAASYASTCRSVRSSLHVAYLYGRGGAVLGVATNRVGSRSRGAGYSAMTIHAERAVLKAVGDTTLLRGATLAVIRVGNKGELLGSKPCEECTSALRSAMRKYGLRRVLYS